MSDNIPTEVKLPRGQSSLRRRLISALSGGFIGPAKQRLRASGPSWSMMSMATSSGSEVMIAVDQWGGTHGPVDPKRPRASLLEVMGRSHADKMYVDRKSGPPLHIGYIIAGYWLTLYQRWEQPA